MATFLHSRTSSALPPMSERERNPLLVLDTVMFSFLADSSCLTLRHSTVEPLEETTELTPAIFPNRPTGHHWSLAGGLESASGLGSDPFVRVGGLLSVSL